MVGQMIQTAPPSAPPVSSCPSAPHPLASSWLFSSSAVLMIGVPSRLVPFFFLRAARIGPHTGPGFSGSTVNQKKVTIHIPRWPTQKYQNGLAPEPLIFLFM